MIPSLLTRCAVGAALLFTWSSSAWPAPVLRGPGGGTVRALVIGIDKYPNLDPASELHGAVADAMDITAALRKVGAKVQDPLVKDVTRQKVITEMDRLVSESKPGDLVIIAYSGHGMRVRGYKRWDGKNRNAYHSQMALSNFSPSEKNGHEVIVDAEMRAWYARLDHNNVDLLVVMDTCYGGHMRDVVPFAGGMRTRALNATVDDKIHDSFVPIQMNEKEAGADTNDMKHVTFFAGATEESTVPEMPGIDSADSTATRGALSYFVARAIRGEASQAGKITRAQLFKYVAPNVRSATEGRQFIDFGPRTESDDALQQVVFTVEDDAVQNSGKEKNPAVPPPPPPPPPVTTQVNAVRVAIVNGAKDLFSTIEKANAPFIQSEQSEADVVWDVEHGTALSRGDLIMGKVDASVLGAVIDRTWAVREIQKMATQRIIDVKMGENGREYTLGDQPTLVADGVGNSYLTVVNVAADGMLQLLFPFYAGHDPHMTRDQWTYSPKVDLPLGTDYTVVIATSSPAKELIGWLRTHNGKHDAFELPGILARTIKADGMARLGTAGLFTR
jgi:Caspase domain